MPLPIRLQRNVENLLRDVTALIDRSETEPEAFALLDPLKRLRAELKDVIGSGAQGKKKARPEVRLPPRAEGQQTLDFRRPKARRPNGPKPPSQPPIRALPRLPAAAPVIDWEPPTLRPKSRWRSLAIGRTVGKFDPKAIWVFEEIDPTKEPEDRDFRVWCRELLDDAPWSYVPDTYWDEGFLRLEFPPHIYRRMPARLSLTMLKVPRAGSSLGMLREDGRAFLTFTINEVDTIGADQVARIEAELLSS